MNIEENNLKVKKEDQKDKTNDDESTSNENNKSKQSLGESIEDKMDNFFGKIQDTLYGENPDFQKDVPATREMSSGIRKVNKVQTRRNLNRKILGNKGLKAFIIIFIIVLIIGLIVSIVG